MENENKDLKGQSPQENMDVEEKMKEEVSAKIAEAASELQDDINEAGEDMQDTFDEAAEEYVEGLQLGEEGLPEVEPIPEPKKITLGVGAFVTSLIGCVALGLLIMFIGFKAPGWIEKIPEGSTAVKVNGESITDKDMEYYIFQAARQYYAENTTDQTGSKIDSYDWDQTAADDRKVSDIIKENAVNQAIDNVLTVQKSMEKGVEWSKQDENSINTAVEGYIDQYGEEGFALRTKEMGISSPKQYKRMYDVNVLNNYIRDDRASVKHILIKTTDDTNSAQSAETPAPTEDPAAKLQTAQQVLERAKNGEDFDSLMDEFNEDTGESKDGYTFMTGEMVPEFETAAFALKMNEISDIVTSSYGYHIIKRIPGLYEIQNMWASEAKINKNEKKLGQISVSEIMKASADAQKKLQEEKSASSASGN